jgi:hypothetical protein
LTAGLFTLAVASFVFGVTRTSTKVLTIQPAFARVFGVVDACNWTRPDPADVQVPLLTLSTLSLARLRTAAQGLATQLSTSSGGRILMTSDLYGMFAEWEFLLDSLLTLDGLQVLELVARFDESSDLCL